MPVSGDQVDNEQAGFCWISAHFGLRISVVKTSADTSCSLAHSDDEESGVFELLPECTMPSGDEDIVITSFSPTYLTLGFPFNVMVANAHAGEQDIRLDNFEGFGKLTDRVVALLE